MITFNVLEIEKEISSPCNWITVYSLRKRFKLIGFNFLCPRTNPRCLSHVPRNTSRCPGGTIIENGGGVDRLDWVADEGKDECKQTSPDKLVALPAPQPPRWIGVEAEVCVQSGRPCFTCDFPTHNTAAAWESSAFCHVSKIFRHNLQRVERRGSEQQHKTNTDAEHWISFHLCLWRNSRMTTFIFRVQSPNK